MANKKRFLVDLAGTKETTFKVGSNLAVLETRNLAVASGELTGGGLLNSDRLFGLADTGIIPTSYGDATHVPQVVVDSKGRITGVTLMLITAAGIGAAAASHTQAFSTLTSLPSTLAGYGITDGVNTSDSRLTDARIPSGTAGGDLAGSYPNPTLATSGVAANTYGDASHVPIITVDTRGRITNVALAAISGASGGAAGGDLTGTYPNPAVATGAITNAKLTNSTISTSFTGLTGDTSVALGGTLNLSVLFGTALGTVCQGNDSRLTDSRAPNGSAGGSLTGSYPSPAIAASAIVDAMVSAGAAIGWSKISKTGAVASDVGAAAASHTQDFSTLTSLPTTLSGYGITDAATSAITLTGTNSIAGGGNITANRTFSLINDVSSPGNSQYYGTNSSGTKGWFALPSISGFAPVGAQYVCVALDGTLTSERALTAGSGLSLLDSGAGANITLSAVYGTASGTVCQGNDSRLSDSRAPTGVASGDLTGTYPSPTIVPGAIITRFNAIGGTGDLLASKLRVVDVTDPTKKLAFDASGISAATTRTLVIPNLNGTLALTGASQTVSFGSLTVSGGTVTLPATSIAISALNATGTPSSSTYLRGDGTWSAGVGGVTGTGTTGYLATWSTSAVLAGSQYLPAGNFPALTGDVTSTAGALGTTIANGAVTLAKMASMAALSFLGNNTGSTGAPAVLSADQAMAILPLFSSSTATRGAVPGASGVGASYFLCANGTWTIPSGGSGLANIASSVSGNTLTIGGTLTTGRTWTFPDRSDTTAGLGAQTFTGLQTFSAGLTVSAGTVTIPSLSIALGALNASGTPSSSTYLRGDGTWSTPGGSGLTNFASTLTGGTLTLAGTVTAGRAWTFPDRTDTFAGLGAQTFTGLQTLSGSATIYDGGGTLAIVSSGDTTKKLAFSLAGMTSAKTLTIASAQTTTQTLNLPNITATDTLVTLGLGQTLTGANIFQNATTRFLAASTQDAIQITPRAGGTSSFATSITTAILTGSYTLTIPATSGADTFALLGLANTFTGLNTFSNAGGIKTANVQSAGSLILQTNGTTTAITIDSSQNATFAGVIKKSGTGNSSPGNQGVDSAGDHIVLFNALNQDSRIGVDSSSSTWFKSLNSSGAGFKFYTSPAGGAATLAVTITPAQAVAFAAAVGFNGVAPISRPAAAASATDPATTMALANNLRTILINYGLAS